MRKEERSQANFIFSPESGPSISTVLVMVPEEKPAELCKFYKTTDLQHKMEGTE